MAQDSYSMQVIAHVRTDFGSKFAVPRQSGLVEELEGEVVFAPAYRAPEALRGLEGFSHLWLLWVISENAERGWSPTVRPPRLGGNERVGVFASRSPYRPNPLGLSCVRLLGLAERPGEGTVLRIGGADLVDGTPLLDIKPYIYADCHAEASGGFTARAPLRRLEVDFPEALLSRIPAQKRSALLRVLAQDPRPAFHQDGARVYGFPFAGHELRFRVEDGRLHVVAVEE